jgi:hypothetical protein
VIIQLRKSWIREGVGKWVVHRFQCLGADALKDVLYSRAPLAAPEDGQKSRSQILEVPAQEQYGAPPAPGEGALKFLPSKPSQSFH